MATSARSIDITKATHLTDELYAWRQSQLDCRIHLTCRVAPEGLPSAVGQALVACRQRAELWAADQGEGLASLRNALGWHVTSVTGADHLGR